MHITSFIVVACGLMDLWYQRGDLKVLEIADLLQNTKAKIEAAQDWWISNTCLTYKVIY